MTDPARENAPEDAPAARSPAAGWTAAGVLLALGLGLAARMAAWPRIASERGVRLAFDSDPYYHLLQAERLLAGRSVWFDPGLNWPFGAHVLWPPLFDAVVAGATRVAFGAAASRADLERVAALVPVPIGLATLALAIAVGSLLLGRGAGLRAGLLLAVLPPAVLWTSAGAADQHAAEILLSCALVLAFVAAWRARGARARRAAAAGLALATAASFWNWQGAAFNLVLPLLFTGVVHVLLPRDEVADRAPRALAAGLGAGAALLAASLALFGAPGAFGRGDLHGLTGLHVAVVAGAAAFGAVLAAARAVGQGAGGPLRRAGEVVVAGLVPGAVALGAFPVLRGGVVHGLTTLGAANPWYAEIAEFRRIVFSGYFSLGDDLRMFAGTYGLTFLAAALAVPALARRARAQRDERATLLFLACWAIPLLALALVRRRFAPYLSIPLALLAAEGLWVVGMRAQALVAPSRRALAPGAALVAAAVALAPTLPALTEGVTTPVEGDVAAMQWLARQPGTPGREGVLPTWDLGHLVQYFAGKPVVVSPFGTDGGAGAMDDAARFALASDPQAAAELLARRRVGFVVLSAPLDTALIDQGFLGGPPGAALVTARYSPSAGRTLDVAPGYFDGIAARLFYLDGRGGPGRRVLAIDTQRLVYESEGQRIKIFAFTPGAELHVEGAPPLGEVTASVHLRTNQGRPALWTASAAADAKGRATLRVPYATGMNGAVDAGAPWVRAGTRGVPVTLAEGDVVSGARVRVAL